MKKFTQVKSVFQTPSKTLKNTDVTLVYEIAKKIKAEEELATIIKLTLVIKY